MKNFYKIEINDDNQGIEELAQNIYEWHQQALDYFLKAEPRYLENNFIDSLIETQDRDGYWRLLTSTDNIPSDARVEFWYWPTYLATAILLHEKIRSQIKGEQLSQLGEMALLKGLSAATGRRFEGHGYDAESDRINVIEFYLAAGVQDFFKMFPAFHTAFSKLFGELIDDQYASLLKGDTCRDFKVDFKKRWLSIQAKTRIINRVFVYGSLMSFHAPHQRYLAKNTSRFVGKGYIEGYSLYDLGAFPGIKSAFKVNERDHESYSKEIVFGEVYEVSSETMASLDRYEGEGSLYQRIPEIATINEERFLIWTYVYLRDIQEASRVPMGNMPWRAPNHELIRSKYIWYAAYGSNCVLERFLCYIKGGSFRGITKTYPGFKDRTAPIASKPITIGYELYFANQSPNWENGGVCFLDMDKPGQTFGRAYLITREQFEELRDYEGRSSLWYDHAIILGEEVGIPIVTITNSQRKAFVSPSSAYLGVVMEGLRETYGDSIDSKVVQVLY